MNRTVLAIVLVAAGPSLLADDATRLKKAEEYLTLTKADARSKQAMDLMWNSMTTAMKQQLGQSTLPPAAKQILDEFQSDLKTLMEQTLSWESMKQEYLQMTADTFSDAELDDILAFMKTSSGQALASKSEALMARGGEIGQKRAQAIMPEIQKLSQEVVRKLQEVARNQPRALSPQ